MTSSVEQQVRQPYKYGWATDVEADIVPAGLNEDIIRLISRKKGEPEWLLEWRLRAYRHWLTMREPTWANVQYEPVDYQAIQYYAAPRKAKNLDSLDEVDPKVLETFEKLGIPLAEQKRLAGVAVDAVFDSVSVATTFKETLAEHGVIFLPFSEAVREHPELVRQYLGSVVPPNDNFFAALNSAVFTDGSFVFVPKGVRCPMELSTYFRINAQSTGQFERTLIIAEEGAYVSYLEGCSAPMRDENQLHAAVVELVALDDAEIKYSTVQNWFPGDENGKGGIYNFVTNGHHVEVPELPPVGRQQHRRVLFGGRDQQSSAGGHWHQNDPHREEHPEHDRLQGHLRRQEPEHVPRTGADHEERRRRPELLAMRFHAHRGQVWSPHLSVHRRPELDGDHGTRSHHVEDRRGSDLLLPATRHLGRGRRLDDRQRFLQGSLPGAPDGVCGGSAESPGREPGRQCRLVIENARGEND